MYTKKEGFILTKEEFKSRHKDRSHRGDGHRRKDQSSHSHGAKTFRRGRAIAFLDRMYLRRSTLKQQLDTLELQSINPILVGELKAIHMVINEFTHLFEINENEIMEILDKKIEITEDSQKPSNNDEEGDVVNETN